MCVYLGIHTHSLGCFSFLFSVASWLLFKNYDFFRTSVPAVGLEFLFYAKDISIFTLFEALFKKKKNSTMGKIYIF